MNSSFGMCPVGVGVCAHAKQAVRAQLARARAVHCEVAREETRGRDRLRSVCLHSDVLVDALALRCENGLSIVIFVHALMVPAPWLAV